MRFLARLSPLRAINDLRAYLAQRPPFELVFLVGAVAVTGIFVAMLLRDSTVQPEYHPNIIYVQQWRADRSEADILAQQKVDQATKDQQQAELKRLQGQNQAAFKRLDDKLSRLGI